MAINATYSLMLALLAGSVQAHPAVDAFVSVCFKAGQTAERARANMESIAGAPLPFDLAFWDKSLEPAAGTPDHAERRCAATFQGDHTASALAPVQTKMATPPVFGTPIPLPAPYEATPGTVYLEGRELLLGRIAVVHIGTHQGKTFIAVDRLPQQDGVSG